MSQEMHDGEEEYGVPDYLVEFNVFVQWKEPGKRSGA